MKRDLLGFLLVAQVSKTVSAGGCAGGGRVGGGLRGSCLALDPTGNEFLGHTWRKPAETKRCELSCRQRAVAGSRRGAAEEAAKGG